MSYQVLARKWRPKNFSELVGQQQTAQALMNALESQRLHHAYLFTGTRGVGKTTIARILSKSLNCETGITSNPCGVCSSCEEINQGNFVDLLEIDAASKTKVEDTRELLDNVQYRPTRGRYKVYLIDEVHMLSGHSFNALLKTLEEPPPHVIFLLATTDPQKLPVTVLSRCLQFHLRRMEMAEITGHLSQILEAENIEFESEALEPIAKGADGSMRDALSLLDQAIAYSGGKIKKSVVLDMLGSIDREYSFQLLAAIEANDGEQLINVINHIAQFSPDFDELLADWLTLLHQIAVCQATGNRSDERVAQLADSISAADLQLYYQLSLHARRDLAFVPHPRQGFEMAMLRIMAFKPQTAPESSPPRRVNAVSDKPTMATSESTDQKKTFKETVQLKSSSISKADNGGARAHLATAHSLAEKIDHSAPVEKMATEADVKLKIVADNSPLKTVANLALVKNDPTSMATRIEEPGKGLNAVETNTGRDEERDKQGHVKLSLADITATNWHQVTEGLSLEGHGLQILLNSTAHFFNDGLKLDTLEKMEPLLTISAKQAIDTALNDYFDTQKLAINFNIVASTSETPRERLNRLYQKALDDTERALLNDPQVKYLLDQLGATLPKESIILKS